jgi:uncharacterized protein
MIIPDTNLLVYSVNGNVEQHKLAHQTLDGSLSSGQAVGFTWGALLGFVRVSTHRSILAKPLSVSKAFDIVELWLSASGAVILEPTEDHGKVVRRILESTGTTGNLASDAHLAAIAIEHHAEILTFDRDFARFPGLKWRLVGS